MPSNPTNFIPAPTLSQEHPSTTRPLEWTFPVTQRKPRFLISNSEFLRELLPHPDANEALWVTSFAGDPGNSSVGDWSGYPVRWDDPHSVSAMDQSGLGGQNTFFTVSSFRGDHDPLGRLYWPGRRKSHHCRTFCLMIDDVGDPGISPGAKIPFERIPDLPFTWALETSPGNLQIGYRLRVPCEDQDLVVALQSALVAQGLQADKDPGLMGVTRYGRLPVGRNGKSKYRNGDARGPEHFLHHWDPEADASIEQLVEAFGLDLERAERSVAARAGVEGSGRPGDWVKLLADATGRMEAGRDRGADGVWFDATCPWVDEHTDGVDNGSAVVITPEGGIGFSCHHGHCLDRGWVQVRRALLQHEDAGIRRHAVQLRFLDTLGQPQAWNTDRLDGGYPPEVPESEDQVLLDGIPEYVREEVQKLIDMGTPGDLAWGETRARLKRESGHGVLQLDEWRALVKRTQRGKIQEQRRAEVTLEQQQATQQQRTALKSRGDVVAMGRLDFATRMRTRGCPDTNRMLVMTGGTGDTPPRVLPRVDNVALILRGGCGRCYPDVTRNELTGQTGLVPLDGSAGKEMDDEDFSRFHAHLCEDFDANFPREIIIQQLFIVADERAFHPVRDWLGGLLWDGVPRLDTWLTGVTGCEDTQYHRSVGRLIIAGAVARAMNPGCKFDYIPILVGGQGVGKSRLVSALAVRTGWGDDITLNPYNLDASVEQMQGKWIIELGELSGFGKTATENAKQFVTRQVDRYRAPYARVSKDRPRQFIAIGSTNSESFLSDTTGNRRYLPVVCGSQIDVKGVQGIVEQLYAEAVMAFHWGEKLYLAEGIEVHAREVQESHREQDPWQELIAEWMDELVGYVVSGDQPAATGENDPVARLLAEGAYKQEQGKGGTEMAFRGALLMEVLWCRLSTRVNVRRDNREQQRIHGCLGVLGWATKKTRFGGVLARYRVKIF